MVKKLFHSLGSLFFLMASVYMGVLIWKSYVWAKWLHQLNDVLQHSSGGPLI